VIDAHLHLWDPARLDYAWLRHVPSIAVAHTPEDWATANFGIRQAVFVQADCAPQQALDEVDWASSLSHPALDIMGIVAFAPLELGEAAGPHLDILRRRPKVRGVRRSVQNEADGFAISPTYIDGLVAASRAGLSIDVCSRARQLPEVINSLTALFERAHNARVVVDHLGKPDIAAHGADIDGDGWADNLRRLSALPGLHAKLSGLVTQDDWTTHRPEILTPYIRHAIDCFGPGRLMFGGDWPVVDLAGGYRLWLQTFEAAIADLSASDREAICCGTALKFYSPASAGPEATA